MDDNFDNAKGGKMRELSEEVKSNLVTLINQGLFDEAKEVINEYETLISKDPDTFSLKSIILIKEGNFREAEKVLKRGLQIASDNIDMLYNLGYVYENLEQYPKALNCYSIIKRLTTDPEMTAEIDSIEENIKEKMSDPSYIDKPRIAFFVKQGMDSFLGHIIEGLSKDYETKKVVVTDISQIEAKMRWADICWFEWCDELIIYASKLEIAKEKRIVCRLHSYEAFTNYIHEVNWSNVNKVIFVAEHIRNIVLEHVESLKKDQTVVIPNGINVSKFTFRDRQKGFNIAYVGYISYKKGPMLLLHTFKAICDLDNRYKLFIAGQFQDYRYQLYFDQMIKEMGLGNNVIFNGWQDDIDKWLDDKNYILSTSVLESQHLSLMEAMSKGIKPVIHNFVGAKNIYKKNYVWNTIDEAVKMIESDEYDSKEYRSFIMEKYSSKREIAEIRNILNELLHTKISKKSCQNQTEIVELGYIQEILEQFIPYNLEHVNNYNLDNCVILMGKIEKTNNQFDLIECILKNNSNEKLILSGIWYDNASKKVSLPSYLSHSNKVNFIDKVVNEILSFELKYINNIGGFILDEKIYDDFQKNKIAYLWERGVPASQFMPLLPFLKIVERYRFASRYINKSHFVLEAACGFGYGAAYLSRKCSKIVALDIARDNIDFGLETYNFNNIEWVEGNVISLPYENDTFDVYTSFETLEHLQLDQVNMYLSEASRVLKSNGKLIISTPNRTARKNINNPFHIKEYNSDEFTSFLKTIFNKIEYFSVEGFKIIKDIPDNAHTMLAVCTK